MTHLKRLVVAVALAVVCLLPATAAADNWYYNWEWRCYNQGDHGAWRMAKAWYNSGVYQYSEWYYFKSPYQRCW